MFLNLLLFSGHSNANSNKTKKEHTVLIVESHIIYLQSTDQIIKNSAKTSEELIIFRQYILPYAHYYCYLIY